MSDSSKKTPQAEAFEFPEAIEKGDLATLTQNYYACVAKLQTLGPNRMDLSLDSLLWIKREPIGAGPYPHVSLFEAISRIFTDLTLLAGLKILFEEALPEPFRGHRAFQVNFGVSSTLTFDLQSLAGAKTAVAGEAFHVSQGLWPTKQRRELAKLNDPEKLAKAWPDHSPDSVHKLLIFNEESYTTKVRTTNPGLGWWEPHKENQVYFLPVSIPNQRDTLAN